VAAPNAEALGYFQSSLRDEELQCLCGIGPEARATFSPALPAHFDLSNALQQLKKCGEEQAAALFWKPCSSGLNPLEK
jgi:hypothetical protein